MTQFTDEQIMAFADDELDVGTSAAITAAIAADMTLAARVAQHRALRETLFASFASVLEEPIPARLQQAANASTHVAPALSLVGASIRSGAPSSTSVPKHPLRDRAAFGHWGALAATLIVGVLAGIVGRQALQGGAGNGEHANDQLAFANIGGALVAQHQLASALSEQMSSTPASGAAARIGVSFRTGDGNFCRSFTLTATAAQPRDLAGLACRNDKGNGTDSWQIPVLVQADGAPYGSNNYRTAGSETPAAILQEIDHRIVGAPLDAAAEKAALARHWKR